MESLSFVLECVFVGMVLVIAFGVLIWKGFLGEVRCIKVSDNVKKG